MAPPPMTAKEIFSRQVPGLFDIIKYSTWHGPYRLLLSFDHDSGKMTGHGTDDVGDFTCEGIFSSYNFRLALMQKYQNGTGDPKENLGHTSMEFGSKSI
jgi:hypothetical protein